jgi:phospholipid/cholesterol/gamma-HCH transport system permease protein
MVKLEISNGRPFVAFVGQTAIEVVQYTGRISVFFFTAFYRMFTFPLRFSRVMQQINFIGMKSLSVICLTGLFTGLVLGLQGYYTLAKFGSEGVLGAAVALSLIRELGPVLTALMVTGRAGSSMAAEIGIMGITEQIDALETMNIDPIKYLVVPRMTASIICFPLLTSIFNVVGVIGGYLTGVVMMGINAGTYQVRMVLAVDMSDIMGGYVKSLVFALIVSTICCFQGYNAGRRKDVFGARGVSIATTSAVVLSSVFVLVSDYIITSFLL